MINVSVSTLLDITGGRLISGTPTGEIKDVTTDSRKVTKGALFVAVCGERVDGHNFIESSFMQGATCALSEKDTGYRGEKPVIMVPDTVVAMGKIARFVMENLSMRTVGITGSVGKTTTRDMTHAVLSRKFHTLKNENNFNNAIGVPLTVFRADKTHDAAVIEMGMNHFGEIDILGNITAPDVAIITNIGISHIENLGSQENIYKAKAELFPYVKEGGAVILNGDDEILMKHKREIPRRVFTVGKENMDADLVATEIEEKEQGVSFRVTGLGQDFFVSLPIPGEHNVSNALSACAAGIFFGVPADEIAKALETFSMTGMRMDVVNTENVTIINDCYNASPASVSAALSVLSQYDKRKVAVLGDMGELGAFSYHAHKDLGRDVVKNRINVLVTVGSNAKYIAEGAFENGMDSSHLISVDTVEEAYSVLSETVKAGDVVLIKASRFMGFERLTAFLKENY